MKFQALITKRIIIYCLLICTANIIKGQTITTSIKNSDPPRSDYNPIELKSAQTDWVYLEVPSYLWSYGCTVTAAAMLAGYYDRHGFWCTYNGTINGGAAPVNNSWPSAHFYESGYYVVNYDNSIAASKNGRDGRTTDGHVDDFWRELHGTGDPDPWVNNLPPHAFDEGDLPCIADYTGSSQDYFNMEDGGTRVSYYTSNNKLHDLTACEYEPTKTRDITHGLKVFFEQGANAIVADVYTQHIYGYNGTSAGFTFNEFKAEIDAGRPVLIHYRKHTAIGIGYNAAENQYAIYDTWSEAKRIMNWGDPLLSSSNESLEMEGVTVVILNGIITKSSFNPMTCLEGIITGESDYLYIQDPQTNVFLPPGSSNLVPSNTYEITPGTNFSFYGLFDSYNCNTWAPTFNWKMELFHSTGSYVIMSSTTVGYLDYPLHCYTSSQWKGTAISSLPNYVWMRNEDGSINGKVTLETKDNNGYVNSSKDCYIKFKYKQDKPIAKVVSSDNNSITISLPNQSATTYEVSYGRSSIPPFTGASGTEALEGISPINIGSKKVFTLTNIPNQTNIVVRAINQFGTSEYSNMIPFSQYSTLPYSTSFEGSLPQNFWTITSSPNGCISQGTRYDIPHSGYWFLRMATCSGVSVVTNYADLHLNLFNGKEVKLEFWMKDYDEEYNSEDGIWFSDNGGATFKKVYDLIGTNYTNNVWYKHTLDVSSLASLNNLNLTKNFVIRFAQTDDMAIPSDGLAFDDVSVFSTYAPSLNTSIITLSASKDALLMMRAKPDLAYMANTNYGTQPLLKADLWTISGYKSITKGLLDFDLSGLPENVVIKSAFLSLYSSNPQPSDDYKQMSNLSTGSATYKSNASWLKQVIANWDENAVTYNTKPATSDYEAKYLPISTTYTQNYLNIDVSKLIENQLKYPETYHGFLLELDTDIKYARMSFASSDHSNTALHPKLTIEYYIDEPGLKSTKNDESIANDNKNEKLSEIYIHPNPVKDYLNINLTGTRCNIYVLDLNGKILKHFMTDQSNLTIDCSNLAEGTYILRIESDKKSNNQLFSKTE
jgi:hypothetical protein